MAASSITSLSTDLFKPKGAAMTDLQASVEDSLRKRPPSKSNPYVLDHPGVCIMQIYRASHYLGHDFVV
ncbi:hypothetical protein E3N88_13159 [Mikania micrantha]|uniref:Uncharacterized protein n=1 Tax=Mikania micrantha TaxID=192012 RepID=A0A5N6P7P2_9ASTR|nr:hypothetical protein E3N88_13159 [Mikania micrantha]